MIAPQNYRITSPDVNIFIKSALNDRDCKKYFEDLEKSCFKKGILPETIVKRLDYWLFRLSPTIHDFFDYCSKRKTPLDCKTFLERLKALENPSKRERLFENYSNIIKNMLRLGKKAKDIDDVYDSLKRYFDFCKSIFYRYPNEIICFNGDDLEATKIANFLTLKRLSGGKFDDKEDCEHISVINDHIQNGNFEKIFFLTKDYRLLDFNEVVFNWNKNIVLISPEQFYGKTPLPGFLEN